MPVRGGVWRRGIGDRWRQTKQMEMLPDERRGERRWRQLLEDKSEHKHHQRWNMMSKKDNDGNCWGRNEGQMGPEPDGGGG